MLFRQTPGNFHRVAFRPAGGDASPDEYGNFHVNMAWIRSDITTGNLLLKEPQSGTDWFLVELGIEPGIVILFELAIELALACTGLQTRPSGLEGIFSSHRAVPAAPRICGYNFNGVGALCQRRVHSICSCTIAFALMREFFISISRLHSSQRRADGINHFFRREFCERRTGWRGDNPSKMPKGHGDA